MFFWFQSQTLHICSFSPSFLNMYVSRIPREGEGVGGGGGGGEGGSVILKTFGRGA